mmetsp:Transcript_44113/g.138603  ORF Transcript_44113/g.138603 Transcript_44113/m.138603 type:complete len:425 (-) Transcript_44113:1630-2904(-)
MSWQSILENASSRGTTGGATVVFAGAASCGKRAILSEFAHVTDARLSLGTTHAGGSNPNAAAFLGISGGSPAAPLEQAAFRVVDPDGDGRENPLLPTVQVWFVDTIEAVPLLEEVLSPASIGSLQVLLAVDAQRPRSTVSQAQAWLEALNKTLDKVISEVDETSADALMAKQRAYRRAAARSTDGTQPLFAEAELVGGGTDGAGGELVCVAPLLLLACNSRDSGAHESFEAHQKLRYLQFRLRRLALEMKAAFGFLRPTGSREGRVAALQQYICHRLHPTLVPFSIGVVDNDVEIFFPETFDSADVIDALQTGDQHIPGSTLVEEVFPAETADTKASTADAEAGPTLEIDGDESWLSGLEKKQTEQIASFEENLVAASQGLGLSSATVATKDAGAKKDPVKKDTTEDKSDPSNVTAFFSNLLNS